MIYDFTLENSKTRSENGKRLVSPIMYVYVYYIYR